MDSKLIIFDFDGVLMDSFDYVYEINRLTAKLVGKKLTKEYYRNMFLDGSFHKQFFQFLSLDDNKLKEVLEFKYKIYHDYYSKAKLFTFASDLINDLAKKGTKMTIVSSAHQSSIENMLKKYNLLNHFEYIFGMSKLGKVENLEKCVKLCNVKKENSYFITDTVGDIKEGLAAGLKTIAVTWGFHNKELLNGLKPSYLINNPKEINNII